MKINFNFRNDECALNLTFTLEAIFLHGYQSSVSFIIIGFTHIHLYIFQPKYPCILTNIYHEYKVSL